MNALLPFIVSGIAAGSIYGLAGSGLVLSYRTSGIFNFGYGALATTAVYLFYWMHVDMGWDWKLAFALSVFVAGPIMGLLMELLARRLAPQRTAMKVVGTIGMILIVQGLGTVKYGPDAKPIPQYLPKGEETFQLFGVNVTYGNLIVVIIACVCVLALYLLLRFTRSGLRMRAVVDDADLLASKGADPAGVRRLAWIISSTFAALSGVLVAPMIGLDPIALTFLVVQAFGAAAIGAFRSMPLTFAGGIVIGIVADISTKYVLDVSWLWGLPASLPFIVLFIVLLVLPRRKLVRASLIEARRALEWRAPVPIRIVTGVIVLALLLIVPFVVGSKLPFFAQGLTQAILLLSLGLLVRVSGQVSLCHTVFAAVGAVAFAQLAGQYNMNWFLALILSALIAVPVGAIVAIPAIRLSGLFLALATFGFAIMVERLLYPLDFMFTTYGTGRVVPRPSFAQDDKTFYYVVLAGVIVTAAIMILLYRGRLGRMLRGMGDSPVAVASTGLSTNVTRVLVFCISAFFAGIAGILYGGSINIITGNEAYYSSFNSLVLIAVLTIAPFSAIPWYALFAGVTIVIPGYITAEETPYWLNVVFGFFAVLVASHGGPRSMPLGIQRRFDRLGEAWRRRKPVKAPQPAPQSWSVATTGNGKRGLEVRDLTVRFGGLVAVRELTLKAPTGAITGLIGPNGAGKTTTFNAVSGMVRPASGVVALDTADVSRLRVAARARRGLGRTFQVPQLCESLTVAENVALGRETGLAGRRVHTQLWTPRTDRRITTAATMSALELCGVADLARRQAGGLSTGQRRLVELARCLAGPFRLLLLDEPSAGLDRAETEEFGAVLRDVVRERGVGILLVEHDMSLVMSVCSYLYVLDFGALIYQGTPAEVATSDEVRNAYLGSEALVAGEQAR
ncbi:branched-chain amino acid ABC transporter permease/ATP-binding protein [Amycolatopsis sp. GM8]|uniref:branched-chain amino acid ABC transporter permease/ATP-binding protein n=1 Tax=Amycolatopsis sp. GM8 TaxID=2896530 RepID=UPI001F0091C9|nr:branched-chain amino acid ABC transporter permease/ATP-binding protein [Amycolatopsis sp. GM8]